MALPTPLLGPRLQALFALAALFVNVGAEAEAEENCGVCVGMESVPFDFMTERMEFVPENVDKHRACKREHPASQLFQRQLNHILRGECSMHRHFRSI